MIYEIKDTNKISPLFGHWERNPYLVMPAGNHGENICKRPHRPYCGYAVIGIHLFRRRPCPELIAYRPPHCTQNFMIAVPQNKLWENMLTQFYGKKAKIIFSLRNKKREPPIFNKHHLEKIVASLPKQYTLSMIDSHFYKLCKSEAWSKDLVSQFSTYEKYRRLGIGVVISKDGLIISGASSYSRYQNGIEIEIDTRKEYRRNGFACICAAKLILECLKRNLYPSWDAHNKASAALAEKLGYHYSHAYTALEIWDY